MHKILSPAERTDLIKCHRQERDKKICDRIKAVIAYDDGYSYSEIARILLLDDATIGRHVEDYQRTNKLTIASGGSESKLTSVETEELCQHLREVTYLYVKEICAYIWSRYHKKYSVGGMTKWLHAHKFSYKKPHAVPARANRAQQEAFIAYYRKLKQRVGNREPIYFADGVHPQHQTQLAYGWIYRGERKPMATTGKQERLHIMGGICLKSHRFIYQQVEKINAESIVSFITRLRQLNPGKYPIHLIWDNASYHRDRRVQKRAKALAIRLHYLPPYSPNLNPMERLWKLLQEQVRYNRYYAGFPDFREATMRFLKSIGRKKLLLRRRINDNFHVLHSPSFAI